MCPNGLATSLMLLLDHPERWTAMGLAGHRKVEEGFDSHRLNDQLVAEFRALGAPSNRAEVNPEGLHA